MIKSRLNLNNPLLPLLVIALITFIAYSASLHNFFFADDLIWLDRVKHLSGNWSSIFNIENRYFTPLTYISFYLNQKLFGMNPYWYHLHDVLIHAMNGMLLYFLACRLSGSRLTACIAACLFVSSASILITVLWPAARTDLIMGFFSLATLITFAGADREKHSVVPIMLYLLALSAKGTALILPVILLLLIPPARPLRWRFVKLLPYIAINVIYLSLLALVNSLGASKTIAAHSLVSFANFARSLPTLFVPERYLAETGVPLLAVFSVITLVLMIGLMIRYREITLRVGATLTVFGILPLIFTRDYVLAGRKAAAMNLLSSPSNRVYLAAAGISLVYAVLLAALLRNRRYLSVRIFCGVLLAGQLCLNLVEIHDRNKKWAIGTRGVRRDLLILERNRALLMEGKVFLLHNFEGSSGFSRAMINTFFDLGDYEVNTFDRDYIEELTDIDRSPLNNSRYDYNSANVKLIMDCNVNPYTDLLTQDGNLILQTTLADFRYLSEAATSAEQVLIRTRQKENLMRLKNVLYDCLSPPRPEIKIP